METLLLEYKPQIQNRLVDTPSQYAGIPELDIIRDMKTGKIDPRNLGLKDRMNVVAVLRSEGLKNYEIASVLKCSTRTIDRYIRRIKENDAGLVKEITIEKLAGNLIRFAEQRKANAIKNGNDALAWQIECQLIDKLQSLGFIYKKPIQVESTHQEEVNVTVTDQREQEELRREYREFLNAN